MLKPSLMLLTREGYWMIICVWSLPYPDISILEDTFNQMVPIKSRLITIHSSASWYGDEIVIEKRLKRKLECK